MHKKCIVIICVLLFLSVSLVIAQVSDIGGRVVFASDRDGNPNLWILDLKTNETYRITNFPGDWGIGYIDAARWSSDGKMIAFIATMDWRMAELFIINDDGSNLRQLTNYPTTEHYANYLAWNPNSLDFVYYGKIWPAWKAIVHRVNVNTLEDIEIPNAEGMNTLIWDITSSGTEYLFAREPSCCRASSHYTGYQDFEGTYERVIKPYDGYAERIGRINRLDNWIIYAESHSSSGSWPPDNIYKMDENGHYVTQLTFGITNEVNRFPVWTVGNNEGYIIFESNRFGDHEIVLMKAEPSAYPEGIINLTNDPSNDLYPDWTPYGSNEPPVALCNDIEIAVNETCQASITVEDVDGGSYDPDEGDTITLSMDNLGPFPLGVHYVNLTVTDEHGESDSCQAKVTVIDTTPPVIENFSVSPSVLWPPDHKMVLITPTIIASDNCGPSPAIELISITMNEGDETNTYDPNFDSNVGDGNTVNDIQVDDNCHIYLRAERMGPGTSRIYSITFLITDASGNSSTASATVTVQHNR